MHTPSPELIKKIKDDQNFLEFRNYLLILIDEFDSVSNLPESDDKKMGEMINARISAVKMIQVILYPFLDFKEKREKTEKEVLAAKAKFGLS